MNSCVDQLHSDGDLQRLQDKAFVSDKKGYSFCSLKEEEEKMLSENDKKNASSGNCFPSCIQDSEINPLKPPSIMKENFLTYIKATLLLQFFFIVDPFKSSFLFPESASTHIYFL